ncbi:hypothetical protein BDW75DRAFT_247484 [Aspergillus navahoensis]
MSQGNEVYCPFCSGPAAENCYGEHLLDPANTPPSPELAEALYTSISTLIFSSSLVAEEDPNPNRKDICLGGLTETQFPAEMDEVLQFAETNPSFYQSLSQESQRSAAEHENSQSYSLLPVHITRRRRRSKSDPSGTAVATEKYIAQITEIQVRAWQALREIERAKNTLWLPRAQHDLWDEAIALGRERVRIYERKKTQGTLRLKLAKEFLSRLEELDARVQIGLIKATF